MPIYKTGKTKNGKAQYRVIVNYTDRNGTKQTKTKCVYGYSDAAELELDFKRRIKAAELPSGKTIQKLYDEYIASKKHEVRASSLHKTESVLKNHVMNTFLPKKRLDKLTAATLQEWKNGLAQKDIMISTKNNAIRELNAMLNYAVRMEYIPRNPLKNVGKFKDVNFTPAQEKVRYYTPEQFKQYMEAAKSTCKNLLDYCCCIFFYIAFYTGMRKGEIHALKWSDIEGNVIHIRRSLNQKERDENGNYLEGPPKNKYSVRDIQIPKQLISLLDEHKQLLDKNIGYNDDYRVCGGYKPIPDTTLANRNKHYSELAGLPHRTIHEFRHSHATVLCNNNINIMEVSRRLGHEDVKMTWNTYAHLYPKAEEMALEVLEAI